MQKALGVMRGAIRRIRDAVRAARYDLVVVYRESAPVGPPLFERMLRWRRLPYVFDFDDAIFLAPIHPANRRWGWLRHPSRVVEAVRGAASVIAGNDYLAAWAVRHNPNVTVIETPVDTERHRPSPRPAGNGRREGDEIVVGWIGSSTTAPYLHLVDDALAVLAERIGLVVRVVGGTYEHPRVRVENLPYRLETEVTDVATFDIGILPEPDDAWTRGKGAFKALVYMASALPVVASRVGVNASVVLDGETGYCVDGTEGWIDALWRLATDPGLRERLGAKGRQRAVERHSLAVKAPVFAQVLRAAARAS